MSDLTNQIRNIVFFESGDGHVHIDVTRRGDDVAYTAYCNLKPHPDRPTGGSVSANGSSVSQVIQRLQQKMPPPEPLPGNEVTLG